MTDETVLFSSKCSYVPRMELLSLVGGTISVTSERLVFVPNALASLIGRRRWVLLVRDVVQARTAQVDLRWWPGPLAAVQFEVEEPPATSATVTRTIVMANEQLAVGLTAAIKEARRSAI